jgi:5-methylcytosine-specific restriction endonuclease McrA
MLNDKGGTVRICIPARIRKTVYRIDGGTCVYCGFNYRLMNGVNMGACGSLSVDHLIPVSKGGSNKLSNLVTACSRCNNQKNDRQEDAFESFFWITSKRRKLLSRWFGVALDLSLESKKRIQWQNQFKKKMSQKFVTKP